MPDIFGEQESVVLRPFMSEKSRRVGVPGGRQVDPRHTWQELFSWRGGALKVAATSVSTYVHILVYMLLCVVATVVYDYHLDADDDDDSHDEPFQRDEPRKLVLAFVTLSIDSATVSAIAFLVAFSASQTASEDDFPKFLAEEANHFATPRSSMQRALLTSRRKGRACL